MNCKAAGIFSMICAPFLFIDFLTATPNVNTSQTGVFDLIYMTGWMCSLIALQQRGAFGTTKAARIILLIQAIFLTGAQVWNIWVIIRPSSEGTLFRIFDSCWPLSNIWMLATGIVAIKARRLQGWQRFVPLAAGLWFPFSMVLFLAKLPFWLSGLYSTIAYILLGLVVYKSGHTAQETVSPNAGIAY